MTKYEIINCQNVVLLEKEAGLTTKRVVENLKADETLMRTYNNRISVDMLKWFLKKVLIFNNCGQKII